MDTKGKIIAFEGIDGTGKTTQVKLLVEYLQSQGQNVVTCREPGGTELGAKIREILLNGSAMEAEAELLLFYSSRIQLVRSVIEPALDRGMIVIMDRFVDSTMAYQGCGRQLNSNIITADLIISLEKMALRNFDLDHVLFLFAQDDVLAERLSKRTEFNRLDAEDVAFRKRVNQGYIDRYRERQAGVKDINLFPVVDATGSVEEVHAWIKTWADKYLLNKN